MRDNNRSPGPQRQNGGHGGEIFDPIGVIVGVDLLEDGGGSDPLALLAAFVGRPWEDVAERLGCIGTSSDVYARSLAAWDIEAMIDEGRGKLVAGAPSPLRSSAWAAELVIGCHQ